jgi:hypothetical protein
MLPIGFQFSQSNLQDYVDCPRRFQLRYVQAQAWPAVQVEPVLEHEAHLERGARFHRLVERHQLGMDPAVLAARISDPDLRVWWEAYLGFSFLHDLEGWRYPEFTLSTEVVGERLAATVDLLVVVPGERVLIFDWKTYRRKPSRRWLAERLQTRVYSYVVARVGSRFFGSDLLPDQVLMVYWVACASAESVVFEYSTGQFIADAAYLVGLVQEVGGRADSGAWPLVDGDTRCRFCEYRSLCGRGIEAGKESEFEELCYEDAKSMGSEVVLGLGDVGEVGF